jgi:hypothetical protein
MRAILLGYSLQQASQLIAPSIGFCTLGRPFEESLIPDAVSRFFDLSQNLSAGVRVKFLPDRSDTHHTATIGITREASKWMLPKN